MKKKRLLRFNNENEYTNEGYFTNASCLCCQRNELMGILARDVL